MTDQERIDAAIARKFKALQAIAAGVALSPGTAMDEGLDAVSLRVGVISMSSRVDALIWLAMSKGASYTQADFEEAVADQMELRQQSYETGLNVKLDDAGMAPIAAAAAAVVDSN